MINGTAVNQDVPLDRFLSSRLLTPVTRSNKRAIACIAPQAMKFKPAPCHNPLTNITKAKHLQHELDRSKRYFQLLFDSVPCYISLQDRDYRILETNELFRQDFGQREGERCYQAYKGRDSICPE